LASFSVLAPAACQTTDGVSDDDRGSETGAHSGVGDGSDPECLDDEDCPEGSLCADNVCINPNDCLTAREGDPYQIAFQEAIPRCSPSTDCTRHSDCNLNEFCVDDWCSTFPIDRCNTNHPPLSGTVVLPAESTVLGLDYDGETLAALIRVPSNAESDETRALLVDAPASGPSSIPTTLVALPESAPFDSRPIIADVDGDGTSEVLISSASAETWWHYVPEPPSLMEFSGTNAHVLGHGNLLTDANQEVGELWGVVDDQLVVFDGHALDAIDDYQTVIDGVAVVPTLGPDQDGDGTAELFEFGNPAGDLIDVSGASRAKSGLPGPTDALSGRLVELDSGSYLASIIRGGPSGVVVELLAAASLDAGSWESIVHASLEFEWSTGSENAVLARVEPDRWTLAVATQAGLLVYSDATKANACWTLIPNTESAVLLPPAVARRPQRSVDRIAYWDGANIVILGQP